MIKHLFFALITIFSLNSQEIEPVTWSYEVEKLSSLKYKITFDAQIIDGWKLYSQFSPEEGSVSTSFNYINNPHFNNRRNNASNNRCLVNGRSD